MFYVRYLPYTIFQCGSSLLNKKNHPLGWFVGIPYRMGRQPSAPGRLSLSLGRSLPFMRSIILRPNSFSAFMS